MSVEKERKGFVLVMVALVLVILLGFVALAVDVGVAYGGRTAAQAAADAGALSGAFAFVVDPNVTETEIRDKAIAAANVNEIMGEPVTLTPGDVNVDMVNRRVTVHVSHAMNTFFAKALGINAMDIGVVAVAEASKTPTGAYCLKPFVIPGTALTPGDPCVACSSGQVLINPDGTKTDYAKSVLGDPFMIKAQDPEGAWVPSNFMAAELSGGGADNYRSDIAGCTGVVVKCGDLLNIQTGLMGGPTRQGVQGGGQIADGGLIGNPADEYHGIADYGPNHSDTSRSLIVAPLWNTCLYDEYKSDGSGNCPATSIPSGSNFQLKVHGFALIFVEGVQDLTNPDGTTDTGVVGRMIDVFGCESGTGPTEPGPYSLPVRLIRP